MGSRGCTDVTSDGSTGNDLAVFNFFPYLSINSAKGVINSSKRLKIKTAAHIVWLGCFSFWFCVATYIHWWVLIIFKLDECDLAVQTQVAFKMIIHVSISGPAKGPRTQWKKSDLRCSDCHDKIRYCKGLTWLKKGFWSPQASVWM